VIRQSIRNRLDRFRLCPSRSGVAVLRDRRRRCRRGGFPYIRLPCSRPSRSYRTAGGPRRYSGRRRGSNGRRAEGRTIRFERDIDNLVRFDTMVDAVDCLQTRAEWSYRYLAQHSITEELRTGRPVTARIPERELLFAVKLYSGRKTDARDLVVFNSAM
jgi:hypothetical protein